MDLALTVTHFPERGLTYAILFGCSLSTEQDIIRRLSRLGPESSYPLLLPGIFAELERIRHAVLAEEMIDRLENRIYELDYKSGQTHVRQREQRHKAKREDYLDTAYVKNGLLSWRKQLVKMAKCVKDLERARFGEEHTSNGPQDLDQPPEPRIHATEHQPGNSQADKDGHQPPNPEAEWSASASSSYARHMRRAGRKVLGRLHSIIDEYDDKVRDCSMRLDGMAMATQWVS